MNDRTAAQRAAPTRPAPGLRAALLLGVAIVAFWQAGLVLAQMADSYRQAAGRYRQLAANASSPQDRMCYNAHASYYDCLAGQLGSGGGRCTAPTCSPGAGGGSSGTRSSGFAIPSMPSTGNARADAFGQALGALGSLWVRSIEREEQERAQREERAAAQARQAEREEEQRRRAEERAQERMAERQKRRELDNINEAIDRELNRDALNARLDAELAKAQGAAATAGEAQRTDLALAQPQPSPSPLPDIGPGSGRQEVFPTPADQLPAPDDPAWRGAFDRVPETPMEKVRDFFASAGEKLSGAWESTKNAASGLLDTEALSKPGNWLADRVANSRAAKTVEYTRRQVEAGVDKVQETARETAQKVDLATHCNVSPEGGPGADVWRSACPVDLMRDKLLPGRGATKPGADVNRTQDAVTRQLGLAQDELEVRP